MQTETVTCGGCGAPLTIPENVEYVACRFCQAQLHVQRNQSVVFTEVLQSLHDQTARIADNTEILRLQNDLARLDKEWSEQSANYGDRDSEGRVLKPDPEVAQIEGPILVGLAIVGTVAACFFSLLLGMIGFVSIFAAIAYAKSRRQKVEIYADLLARYQRKRTAILDRMHQLDARV